MCIRDRLMGESETRGEEVPHDVEEARKSFIKAMEDDFNTPKALAEIYKLVRSANAYIQTRSRYDKAVLRSYYDSILELSRALGLLQKYSPRRLRHPEDVAKVLEILLRVREELRKRRLYEISDSIRDQLARVGILIEDTDKGPRVRFQARR
mgnify:CR=1 FL=1